MCDSVDENKRMTGLPATEAESYELAYSAALAEFLTDFCRGERDPVAGDADTRQVAQFAEHFFRRGYQARRAGPELPEFVRAALADAARGFVMLAENSAPDASPEWLAECRRKADVLTAYINSFSATPAGAVGETS